MGVVGRKLETFPEWMLLEGKGRGSERGAELVEGVGPGQNRYFTIYPRSSGTLAFLFNKKEKNLHWEM